MEEHLHFLVRPCLGKPTESTLEVGSETSAARCLCDMFAFNGSVRLMEGSSVSWVKIGRKHQKYFFKKEKGKNPGLAERRPEC